jgi:hypothetical protein
MVFLIELCSCRVVAKESTRDITWDIVTLCKSLSDLLHKSLVKLQVGILFSMLCKHWLLWVLLHGLGLGQSFL